MALKRIKILKHQSGTYRDQSTGEYKPSYQHIGALLQDDESGEYQVRLDALPFPRVNQKDGTMSCVLYAADPPERQVREAVEAPRRPVVPQARRPAPSKPAQADGFVDDDIPF